MAGDGGRWWEMAGDGGRWWEMAGDGGRWREMVGDGGGMDRETPSYWQGLHVADCADGSPVSRTESPTPGDGGRWWGYGPGDGGRWWEMAGDGGGMDRETPSYWQGLHVADCADGSPVATLEVPLQEMVGDGGRWWEMVGDGGRWWEMAGDGGRWWEMAGDGGRWREMAGDGGRWREMAGDGGRWWEMVGDGGRWWEMAGDGGGMDRETPSYWQDLHVADCADGSPVATLEVPLQVRTVDVHVVVLLVLRSLHHAARLSCNTGTQSV